MTGQDREEHVAADLIITGATVHALHDPVGSAIAMTIADGEIVHEAP